MTLLRTGNEFSTSPKMESDRTVSTAKNAISIALFCISCRPSLNEMNLSLSPLCRLYEVDIRGIFR